MFDTFRGLPVHILTVHAVVVLVPLCALGLVVVALVPRWRARFAAPLALFATAALVAVPIATRSGNRLRERLDASGVVGEQIARHKELGDQVIWFVLAMWVLAVLLWLVARTGRRGGAVALVAILAAVAGLAAAGQVVRAGEAGSNAVWKCTITPEACTR